MLCCCVEVRLICLKALFSSWGGSQGSAFEENWGEVAGVDQSGGEAECMNDGWGVSERARGSIPYQGN